MIKLNESNLEPPEEFEFPFTPYSIQKEFMKNLYSAIENKKLGVFESPTGTGKSMSIICGAVKWLFDANNRHIRDIENEIILLDDTILKAEASSSDWLDTHHQSLKAKNKKVALRHSLRSIDEAASKIEKVKAKARKARQEGFIDELKKFRKPVKIDKNVQRKGSNMNEEKDDCNINDKEIENDEDLLLTDDGPATLSSDSDEENSAVETTGYVCPKIFLCSRTHSQLTQLSGEIFKSPFRELGVRVVSLASRQNMCINDSVLKLKNMSLINEACQDLRSHKSMKTTKVSSNGEKIKKLKTSGGCPFTGESSMDVLRGECLSNIIDLEEMVATGRSLSACPYYTARNSVEDAHIVLLPYNTLLHQKTREASGINLQDSVVIIDEAHNLLDTLGNIHSASVAGLQICHAHSYLIQYRDKFRDRFSPMNLLHLNQLIFVMNKLARRVNGKFAPKEPTSISKLSNFLIETEIDNINLFTLLKFSEQSRLAQKLRSYLDKFQPSVNLIIKKKPEGGVSSFLKNIANKTKERSVEDPSPGENSEPPVTPVGNPIHAVLAFLNALTNHCDDGRVVVTVGKTPAESTLKFLLLNPAAHFQDIITQARSVVLAGGTMQPFSEFTDQLFLLAGADAARIHTFSCDHVVPPSNILPMVLSKGPSGRTFDFSFANRNNAELLDELGRLLVNACCVIPAGVVVFFTSYEYEDLVYRYFVEKGIIAKLEKKKKVLREPKQGNHVEKVLAEYGKAATTGALLFSVVGGKLSEGLNFNDDLGRCVVVVGLPFPNKTSPELREKMTYMEEKIGKGAGSVYYENLCMKAVNQSIGRSVRHIADYAAVLLLDQRYVRHNIQSALPQWIRNSLQAPPTFRPVQAILANFFSSKKGCAT